LREGRRDGSRRGGERDNTQWSPEEKKDGKVVVISGKKLKNKALVKGSTSEKRKPGGITRNKRVDPRPVVNPGLGKESFEYESLTNKGRGKPALPLLLDPRKKKNPKPADKKKRILQRGRKKGYVTRCGHKKRKLLTHREGSAHTGFHGQFSHNVKKRSGSRPLKKKKKWQNRGEKQLQCGRGKKK